MGKCTKENCPMNASTLNPDCDVKNCPYRTERPSDERVVRLAMIVIKTLLCERHRQCENCNHYKKYIGCEFRRKSPRDWKI